MNVDGGLSLKSCQSDWIGIPDSQTSDGQVISEVCICPASLVLSPAHGMTGLIVDVDLPGALV